VLTASARRLSVLGALLAVAALVLPPAAAGTTSPSPSPSPSGTAGAGGRVITFGIGPATQGKVDRRPNFNLLLPKGNVAKDEVAIVNLTYQPLTLNLYAADAINTPDGQLSLQPAAEDPVDAAAWVTFKAPGNKGFVVVKPRSTLVVPFTVKVPKDAYVGDHLAGIVASTITRGQTPGDRATDVQFEQRIAVRLAVRVAGELKPQLTVENLTANYSGSLNPFAAGTVTLTYTVRNTGNIRLGGAQSVGVDSLFGTRVVAPDVPDIPLLLPGGSATVTVPVNDVQPLGLMTALVDVAALAPAGDANPSSELASARVQFWAVPWLLIAVILLLGLLLFAIIRRRRRRSPEPTGRRMQQPDLASSGAPRA